MNTAIINFTTEPKLKSEAQKTAKRLGIPLSLALNNYLRQFVRMKSVTFREEIPNAKTAALLKQSEEDIKVGRVLSFENGRDALAYLDREIKHERKKSAAS